MNCSSKLYAARLPRHGVPCTTEGPHDGHAGVIELDGTPCVVTWSDRPVRYDIEPLGDVA